MTILRVNLYKVNAERNLKAERGGQVSIKNNVSLKDVQEIGLEKDGKKGLRFDFEFDCKYDPDMGKISVGGEVFYVEETKLVNEIKESWDKNQNVPTAVMEEVLNAALHKGNIQAIKLADEVKLPNPLPLPKVAGKKK